MRPSFRCTLLALFLIGLAHPVHAQDHRAGISVAYPGAIGVIWQPAARFAIRPDVAFSYTSTGDQDTTGTSGWTVGTHVTGLIYLRAQSPFRVYLAPRYGYRRSTTTISTTGTPAIPINIPGLTIPTLTISSTGTRHEHSGAGLVGGEYTWGDHFGVFGELGIEYAHATSNTSQQLFGLSSISSSPSWNIGTTTSIGVSLYF